MAVLVGALAVGVYLFGFATGLVRNPREFAYIRIAGEEMEPTLREGDWLLVERGYYAEQDRSIRRGDLVWVEPPESARRSGRLILRVAGLPHETITWNASGELNIDGERIEGPEPLLALVFSFEDTPAPVELGPNEYFLVGDNSEAGVDSRRWGPVERKNVRGKAISVLFPPTRAGRLEGDG